MSKESVLTSSSITTIQAMADSIVKQIAHLKVYLFSSFAKGRETEESDFDFYIVVEDGIKDLWDVTAMARMAVRDIKTRPVDIVVGTRSRFEKYGRSLDSFYVEGEVLRKGVLLYDRDLEKTACF